MTRPLKVALAQQPSGRNPADTIEAASRSGADIVVFPEMYSNGYARFEPGDAAAELRWRAGALDLESDYVRHFRDAARANGVHVVATLLEAGDPDPFNAALLIDPQGDIVLHHRKVHVCDFDSPESACGRGTTFDVVEIETSAGPLTVGLMVCMDREYPDSAATLSAKGAEVALVPNACMLATDESVGDVRLAQIRGRAFESVMGIALANYPAPKCDGRSLAVDPLGRMITLAGAEPAIVLTEFDLAAIRATRRAEHFRWQQGNKSR